MAPAPHADQLSSGLAAAEAARRVIALDRESHPSGTPAATELVAELGERWARGDISVGQELFASRLIEGRLLTLARGWNKGPGPRAILACPPGEQHTVPLLASGLVLRGHGWRNTYLGADLRRARSK